MATNKHISKIIIVLMAAAVVLCFVAIAHSHELVEALGGTGVTMEYESKLFNTDEVISIDIRMDEDDWEAMLNNPLSEEYYVCDVVINGQKIKNVGIRPKGNTSLSAIAMDADNDRYSLKLEFDHFVEGQTCYGLDKLILNNNYADATNMKEAIIYDMFQYLGTDASLYNYAKISVNGEYWGVYLALEAVEESFMLRNYGTQDGELYKPDSMEMGSGKSSGSSSSSSGSMTPPGGGFSGNQGGDSENSGTPSFYGFPGGSSDFDPNNIPEGGNFDFGNMPDMSGNKPGESSDSGTPSSGGPSGFDPSNRPGSSSSGFGGMTPPGGSQGFPGNEGGDTESSGSPSFDGFSGGSSDFDPYNKPDGEGSGSGGQRPDMGDFSPQGGGGGFSMRGGGADLNYVDDELDSYQTIWEGEITGTGKADHRRVVTALKNISEGNDLETYMDVDNILKYMAVHTFAVNMDSLSGSMAHNYYLYEYDGQLNILPWDYNLSLGGMSMGSNGDATEMVNDPIDTPFSSTHFFDGLLENEEYLAKYHEYLQQLVDEYVKGGRFDETYHRIRSQIDELVETDPNALYDYEEYDTAAKLLYETVNLRADSIKGQLEGTIPSTDAGQRQDSSNFVDASHIDVKAMGQFNMGGFADNRKDKKKGESDDSSDSDDFSFFDFGNFFGGEMPDFDPNNMPEGGFDFGGGNMPDMGGFNPGNVSGVTYGSSKLMTLMVYGGCLALMVILLFVMKYLVHRR